MRDTPLAILELPIRTHNALFRAGVETVEQLMLLSKEELLLVRNLGMKAIQDIEEALFSSYQRRLPLTAWDLVRELFHQEVDITQLNEPLLHLDLPQEICTALEQMGISTIRSLAAINSVELMNVVAGSISTIIEVRQALVKYSAKIGPVSNSENRKFLLLRKLKARKEQEQAALCNHIAASHGIPIASSWSWSDLLSKGYAWHIIFAFDAALQAESLGALSPLPGEMHVQVDVIQRLISQGCPLHEIKIERVTVNVRQIETRLKKHKIDTLLQFCLSVPAQLQLESISAEFAIFQEDIHYYLNWLEDQVSWEQEVNDHAINPIILWRLQGLDIATLISTSFNECSEREKRILVLRHGLLGEKNHTLEEVAIEFKLTRERVRQICNKALPRVKRSMEKDQYINTFLTEMRELIDSLFIVELSEFSQIVEQTLQVVVGPHTNCLVFFLESNNIAEFDQHQGILIHSGLNAELIQDMVREARRVLSEAKSPIRLSDLHVQVQKQVSQEMQSKEFPSLYTELPLFQTLLESSSDFILVEQDYWGLVTWEKRITDDIVMVLRHLQRPAHMTEITELVNQRLGKNQETNVRAIHGQLGRYTNLFIRTDDGTFALREHFPDLPSQPERYFNLIVRVFEEEQRAMTIEEVWVQVNRWREAKKSSIGMYLTMNKAFTPMGGNRYGLAKWKTGDGTCE